LRAPLGFRRHIRRAKVVSLIGYLKDLVALPYHFTRRRRAPLDTHQWIDIFEPRQFPWTAFGQHPGSYDYSRALEILAIPTGPDSPKLSMTDDGGKCGGIVDLRHGKSDAFD
jgi:hypothetical protein